MVASSRADRDGAKSSLTLSIFSGEDQEAEPALLTVVTESVNPIPRRRALHDKIETITVEIFTGPRLTFDVEWPELARHVIPPRKPSSEPTAKTPGRRGDLG